jgi:hypothetical protein
MSGTPGDGERREGPDDGPMPSPAVRRRGKETADRAQTTQDFALGVGVFLVTVAFVIAFVPTILVPFQAGPSEADASQAQHLAMDLTDNLTVGGYATRLNETRTDRFFAHHPDGSDIRANYSLPVGAQANVTLENLDGTTVGPSDIGYYPRAGDALTGEPTASSSRILEYDGDSYRLLVRVW